MRAAAAASTIILNFVQNVYFRIKFYLITVTKIDFFLALLSSSFSESLFFPIIIHRDTIEVHDVKKRMSRSMHSLKFIMGDPLSKNTADPQEKLLFHA